MAFERRIDYVTPAFPEGRRVQAKSGDQVEHDRALLAEREALEVVVSALRTLTGTEGWDCYTSQLEIIEKKITEDILQGGLDGVEYQRGYIMGLRKAVHLPAELAQRRNTL